jgi:hypothetical protein
VGFNVDHDVEPGNGMRVVQLTPPGSACSIAIGVGISDPNAAPVLNLHLVVDDLDVARRTLICNGIDVSDVHDMGGGIRYAYFRDPDGKGSRWINLVSGLRAAIVVLWRIWRSRWRVGSRCCGRI